MKKIPTCILSLFFCFSFGFANFVFGQNNPKTLLWKVTKKGSKNESYLFGTFHEVSPTFFNTLSNAVDKLRESDILFVEEKASVANHVNVEEDPLWNFEKWKTILTTAQEATFREFVEKIADSTCYTQSPLVLLLGIARNYMITFCETDTAFTEIMDAYIEKLALAQNKPVYPLDPNHNFLLGNISKQLSKQQDSANAASCIVGMKNTLDSNLAGCKLVTAYRNLDINYELDTDLTPNANLELLLTDRNNGWIKILDKAFSDSNCFVAVGLRHLFYKQGIVQQLRRIGYEVVPIPSKL